MTARSSRALCGAAVLSALLALVWYVSFHTAGAARVNLAIEYHAGSLSYSPHVTAIANFVTGLIQPVPYVFLAAVPVILSLFRRQPTVALAIAGSIAGAIVTTELLKPLLAAQLRGAGRCSQARSRAGTSPPRRRWPCRWCWPRPGGCGGPLRLRARSLWRRSRARS